MATSSTPVERKRGQEPGPSPPPHPLPCPAQPQPLALLVPTERRALVAHVHLPPKESRFQPRSLPSPPDFRAADTHHYSIYNIVTVVLQGTDCLRSGHVRLRHDQLNVFHLDTGFVNLRRQSPGLTELNAVCSVPRGGKWDRVDWGHSRSGPGSFWAGPSPADTPLAGTGTRPSGVSPRTSFCPRGKGKERKPRVLAAAGNTTSLQIQPVPPELPRAPPGLCPAPQGYTGRAHLFFLALLLHSGGLCVLLDV